MEYENTVKAQFLSRPNRFIAMARIEGSGQEVVCHVKNTGRCKELLVPGATVVLERHPDARKLGRKTDYSLIAVYKNAGGQCRLINMDSQAPNQVALEWLKEGSKKMGYHHIQREVTYGQSRLDLAFTMEGRGREGSLEKKALMEVKGVTLEQNGIAMFPDAPTQRGVKHVMELARGVGEGYEAYILFVIQMKGIEAFTPNMETHPAFGLALEQAQKAGVHILAYDCQVGENQLKIDSPVPIRLGQGLG